MGEGRVEASLGRVRRLAKLKHSEKGRCGESGCTGLSPITAQLLSREAVLHHVCLGLPLPDCRGAEGGRGTGGDVRVVLGVKFVLDRVLERKKRATRLAGLGHNKAEVGSVVGVEQDSQLDYIAPRGLCICSVQATHSGAKSAAGLCHQKQNQLPGFCCHLRPLPS